jgi:hypothetical protein
MPSRPCSAPGCYRGGLVLSTTTIVAYTWYPWVRVYVCDACAAPVLDCRSYPVPVAGTTQWCFMTTPRHLYIHHYKYHREPVVAPAPVTDDVDAGYLSNDDAELPLPPLVLHPAVVPPPLQQWLLADFEDSPATHNLLADCTTLDRHRAVKAIMAKTLYGTVAILPSAVAQITRADMLQYLTMAQLVFTVGSTGCALLGRLLGPLYFRVRPTPVLPWPTTAAAYRAVFIDRGYSTSLASCLPQPSIVELIDQDYTVPLRAFVTFATAFATPRDPFHRYGVLDGTNAAVGLRPLVGLTVLVTLWMDDFDANTALLKLNRTSVFAAVATVLLVDMTGSLVAACSNLIAAGNKHGDHEGILCCFGDGLGDCPGQHYCGALGKCVPLRAYLLHAVCDQLAKQALFGLKAGNGKYHACFGYSINYVTLQKPFPACAECRAILFDSDAAPPPCPHCHAWTLPTHNQHLLYAMSLIPELQTALPTLHALNQGGGPLTMDILLAMWDECWADLQAGRISVNEVEAKLDLVCVDLCYQDLLGQAWRNCQTWDRIQVGLPCAPIEVATYTTSHQQDPHLFAQPPPPAVWNYTQLPQWLEAPMHLQMGIMTVAGMVYGWADDLGHGDTLVLYLQAGIDSLRRACQVDKCRLVNYIPSMAGWVADNCRALCLMLPWAYQCLAQDLFT